MKNNANLKQLQTAAAIASDPIKADLQRRLEEANMNESPSMANQPEVETAASSTPVQLLDALVAQGLKANRQTQLNLQDEFTSILKYYFGINAPKVRGSANLSPLVDEIRSNIPSLTGRKLRNFKEELTEILEEFFNVTASVETAGFAVGDKAFVNKKHFGGKKQGIIKKIYDDEGTKMVDFEVKGKGIVPVTYDSLQGK